MTIKELADKYISHTHIEDDSWYSCSLYTCNDLRKSDKCDCGADRMKKELTKEVAVMVLEARKEILEGLDPLDMGDYYSIDATRYDNAIADLERQKEELLNEKT